MGTNEAAWRAPDELPPQTRSQWCRSVPGGDEAAWHSVIGWPPRLGGAPQRPAYQRTRRSRCHSSPPERAAAGQGVEGGSKGFKEEGWTYIQLVDVNASRGNAQRRRHALPKPPKKTDVQPLHVHSQVLKHKLYFIIRNDEIGFYSSVLTRFLIKRLISKFLLTI